MRFLACFLYTLHVTIFTSFLFCCTLVLTFCNLMSVNTLPKLVRFQTIQVSTLPKRTLTSRVTQNLHIYNRHRNIVEILKPSQRAAISPACVNQPCMLRPMSIATSSNGFCSMSFATSSNGASSSEHASST